MTIKTPWIALVLGVPIWLSAQSYQVQTYNEDVGLTAGVIVSMAQAGDGRIWFSGRGNLMIYDSKNWVEPTGAQAPPAKVDQLASDHRGDIWGSSYSNEIPLMRFRGNTWETFAKPEGYISSGGDPYCLAVARFGDEPVAAVAPNRTGLWYLYRKTWTYIGDKQGLGPMSTITLESFGQSIYIAGHAGLYRLTEKGLDSSLNAYLPQERRKLLGVAPEGRDGVLKRLWLMGNGWLGVLEDRRFELIAKVPQVPDVFFGRPVRMMADGCGGLFFGSATDLNHLRRHAPALQTLSVRTGLISDGVVALLQDQERNYWVSSLLGVSKISSMRFANFNKAQGLPMNEVTSVAELSGGRILFAQEAGISLYDGHSLRQLEIPGLSADSTMRPFHLHPSADGSVLAAVMNLGILRVHADGRVSALTRPDNPFAEDILDVLEDGDGTIWVGLKGGLRLLRGGQMVMPEGVPEIDTAVRRLYRTRDGTLLVGCANLGIFRLKNGAWLQITGPDLDSSSIFTFLEDRCNRILVGTQSGLFMLQDDSLIRVSELKDNKDTVYFLVEDRDGRIWMGTGNGVLRMDGQRLRHFTTFDGLQAVETNRGGGFLDSRGQVWIASDRGVSVYQQPYDFDNLPPSNLSITGIEVAGVALDHTQRLYLEPDQNDLTFKFRVISFQDEDGLTFQSWLEGYDKGWLSEYKSDSRSYRYTNLPSGVYRFHVKVHNSAGLWSEEVSSVEVVIKKPFWARIWFLALVLLLLMGICWTILEFVSSKRHSRYLEKQVAERTLALSRKTEQLEERIQASHRAEREIQALNEELEERVRDRTVALELAQRDLVENAHYAGMAEIANSILHNVGNILNSVSTSGYLIRQTIEDSKMTSILRANELLSENMDQLDTFLLQDPRGKQLLRFYLSLGEVHIKERERLLKHTSLLMEKIDAIKDVVAQQHNYASGVYQNEELDPRELIETAIKIIETGFFHHNIVIKRDFHPVPRVMIQKTKFIHTMVNLLKNAKESILAERGEKQITIVVEGRDEWVYIRVIDTGLGIPADNLRKIFSHGFTTKQNGHGFGLHSSANAIQEMGGAMWAESKGEGLGATFVIRLPIVHAELAVDVKSQDHA